MKGIFLLYSQAAFKCLGQDNAEAGTFLKLYNQLRVTTWDLSRGKTEPRLLTCAAAGLAT